MRKVANDKGSAYQPVRRQRLAGSRSPAWRKLQLAISFNGFGSWRGASAQYWHHLYRKLSESRLESFHLNGFMPESESVSSLCNTAVAASHESYESG